MGYLLSLQAMERSDGDVVDAQLASTFSTTLCRSTFSTAC